MLLRHSRILLPVSEFLAELPVFRLRPVVLRVHVNLAGSLWSRLIACMHLDSTLLPRHFAPPDGKIVSTSMLLPDLLITRDRGRPEI